MSNGELAAVKSITYPKDVLDGISRFFRAGSFVDVTIVCGGFQLHAHRVILAACSSYFEDLFRSFPVDRSRLVIALHNIDWDALRLAVDFIYKGETEVPADKLDLFLDVARALEIKDLRSGGEQKPASQNSTQAASTATSFRDTPAAEFEAEMETNCVVNFAQQGGTRDVSTDGRAQPARNGIQGHLEPSSTTVPMRPPDYPVACPSTFNPKGPFERQNDWIWMGRFMDGNPAYFCTGCAAMSVNRSVMLRHSELHMGKS